MTQETMELVKTEEAPKVEENKVQVMKRAEVADITDRVIDSWNDMQRMAKAFSLSGLIPNSLQNKLNDVLVILQMAKELNIPPMQGICGINVIQGKPSIAPQMMLALIYQRVPNCVIEFRESTDKCARVYMSRNKDSTGFESVWDIPRASAMGLTGKDNYKKQPGTMLKWRAVGEAARTVFPDVIQGFYVHEELIDLEPSKPQGAIPTTGSVVVDVNDLISGET